MLGVEPDERMAGYARARGLPVEVATFEAWDAGGRTFDTVIAAQSSSVSGPVLSRMPSGMRDLPQSWKSAARPRS